MKRDAKIILSVVLVCFFLMISVPFASAGWLSNLWNQITGEVVTSDNTNVTICTDSDNGSYYMKGSTGPGTDENGNKVNYEMDVCSSSDIYPNFANEGAFLWDNYCVNATSIGTEKYKCPYGCKDGACISAQTNVTIPTNVTQPLNTSISRNLKNLSKYSDGSVFLVSDKNWEDILPLVPVTTWTQQTGDNGQCVRGYGTADNTCVYPTLIYHNENSGFDADSIIYFMQQYQNNTQEKVTIIGKTPQELDNLIVAQPKLGAGISQDKIERSSPSDYLSYWQSYQDVVYVEDNYELGLMASTYASLLNAPLIIKRTSLDTSSTFTGKNVICVGNVVPSEASCNEQYNLEQLRQKYVTITKTDQIILVNPNDLNINVIEYFLPEKSLNSINEIYSKTSLSAPILASAKHEVIISTLFTDYIKVNNTLKSEINSLNLNPKYLTIVASPDAIQMSFGTDPSLQLKEVDNSIYGHLNGHIFQDFAVGRIFGLTISDISSYVSRDLFYNKLIVSNKFTMLAPQAPNGPSESNQWEIQLKSNDDLLTSIGLQKNSVYLAETNPSTSLFNAEIVLSDKLIINFDDHGAAAGWPGGIWTSDLNYYKIWLTPSLIVSEACLTCAYDIIGTSTYGSSKQNLFCTNFLRRGSLSFIGAIDISGGTTALSKDLIEYIANGNSFGNALKILKNNEVLSKNCDLSGGSTTFGAYVSPFCEPFYILLGDPMFNLNLAYPSIDKVTIETNLTNQDLTFTIKIPQSKDIVNLVNETAYKSPHGINVIKSYIGNQINSDNLLSGEGDFSFSFDSATQQLITPIKAEFIDSSGKITTMPSIMGGGIQFFYQAGTNKPVNSMTLKYIYDEKENKYRFDAYVNERFYPTIDNFSPFYEYKIYLHLGGSS